MVDVRGATNDGLEDVPDVPVDLIVDHGDCGGAGREVVVGDDGKWSGSEKDDDGMVEDGLSDERVRLLERLNRENKQGTLTNFCIEFSSFGARKTTGEGGGWKEGGAERKMNGGSWPPSSTVQNCGGSKNRGTRKIKAQASKKQKKGAKSVSGREPGQGPKPVSSQGSLRNYFSVEERLVEIGTPMGFRRLI